MKVQKRNLLLIACVVWSAAGFNILRIGVAAYPGHLGALNMALSAVVFCVFQVFVFGRLVDKHHRRIVSYDDEYQYFFKFFDAKSFAIMAFMMTGGILLRNSGTAPERFIAVFYSGLGASLLTAGILFGRKFLEGIPALEG